MGWSRALRGCLLNARLGGAASRWLGRTEVCLCPIPATCIEPVTTVVLLLVATAVPPLQRTPATLGYSCVVFLVLLLFTFSIISSTPVVVLLFSNISPVGACGAYRTTLVRGRALPSPPTFPILGEHCGMRATDKSLRYTPEPDHGGCSVLRYKTQKEE